jgi:hypothetical protein
VEGWRRLYNELHNSYTTTNIIRATNTRKVTLAGNVADMGEMRNAYKILGGKPIEVTILKTWVQMGGLY